MPSPRYRLRRQPLLTKDQVRERVYQLGQEIRPRYPDGLTVVSILTGSFLFTADLIRRFEDVPVQVELVKALSYRGTTPGELRVDLSLLDPEQIAGRDVLVVDDIVDTGRTLQRVLGEISSLRPRTLAAAAFLRKRGRQQVPVPLDHAGFEIDDHFVVGYGLDYFGMYRHLSWVGVLEQEP
jgi:hypoxanthine phosphoribosyltransferase